MNFENRSTNIKVATWGKIGLKIRHGWSMTSISQFAEKTSLCLGLHLYTREHEVFAGYQTTFNVLP